MVASAEHNQQSTHQTEETEGMATRRSVTTTTSCHQATSHSHSEALTFLALARRAIKYQSQGWSQAAARLGQQAITSTVDQWWASVDPSMADASVGAKLLCLPTSMTNSEAARSASYTWNLLGSTHPSSPRELTDLLEDVAEFIMDVDDELATQTDSSGRCVNHRPLNGATPEWPTSDAVGTSSQ